MQLHTAESYRNKLKMEEDEKLAQSLFFATMVKSQELEELGLCEMREPKINNPAKHQGEKRNPKLCVHNWPELIKKLKEYHEQEGPFDEDMTLEAVQRYAEEELKRAYHNMRGRQSNGQKTKM